MPNTVRAICWNIKDFSGKQFKDHNAAILSQIYTGDARQLDLFIIVEPFSRSQDFAFEDNVTAGAGLDGVLALYFALAAKDMRWKVVPLRLNADWPESDMTALFYHSDVVDCAGPDHLDGGVVAGPEMMAIAVDVTTNPGGHALPWAAATVAWPQVQFRDALDAEIDFFGRRPTLFGLTAPDTAVAKFTLEVVAPVVGGNPTIVTDLIPVGSAQQLFEVQLQADGGVPPYTWRARLPGTALPAGLAFDAATARLAGVPAAAGAGTLDVELTDSTVPNPLVANSVFNVQILAAQAALGFDTAPALPRALQNAPYHVRIGARGGDGPRSMVRSQKLITRPPPAGISVGADGLVSGTPTVAAASGDIWVQLRVAAHVNQNCTVAVVAGAGVALEVFSDALPDGAVNVAYEFHLQGHGGTAPYTWNANPGTALPPGLAFDPVLGRLHGTPTAAGLCVLDVRITDGVGNGVDRVLNCNVLIAQPTLGFATGAALPRALLNAPYHCVIAAMSDADRALQACGPLPAGLSLSAAGVVSGTPTTAAAHQVTIQLIDARRGFKVLAVHAPPQARAPQNVNCVANLATIREITTQRGGIAVAVCGDFNICTHALQDCGAHDAGELGALNGLTHLHYQSRNANRRSSCVRSDGAQKKCYAHLKGNAANDITLDQIGKHAFDHLLTIGFAAVPATTTVNLVAEDPGYAAAKAQAVARKPSPIKGIVRKYLKNDGVSDHLPVSFTLDVGP